MWEWFTANSVWILVVAGLLLIISFLIRERVLDNIAKLAAKKWQKTVHRIATITFWTIEGMVLAIVAIALVAITLSREGIHSIITTETIEGWFLEHGTVILVILLVGVVLWLALKRFLPPLLRSTMVRTKGESKEGIKNRRDTLLSVFMGAGKVLIIVVITFMVLSELGVPIAPLSRPYLVWFCHPSRLMPLTFVYQI
ncbi:hypothetical protein ACFLYR_02045 [Chloroflexota bacterium]